MGILDELIPLLQPREYLSVVEKVVTHKVNKIRLNQLVRRGGKIAAIIQAATKPRAMRLTKVVLKAKEEREAGK